MDFNPHEREARDGRRRLLHLLHPYFNPHEREARDRAFRDRKSLRKFILIHTSVKLVTDRPCDPRRGGGDFNPHEREARDPALLPRAM